MNYANLLSVKYLRERIGRRILGSIPALSVQEICVSLNRVADHPYASGVERAFERALSMETVLPDCILNMEGMSGRKYRRFINAVMGTINNPRYLEIGSYKGSTACAAISGNKIHAVLIDHWQQFGGKEDFDRNILSVLTDDVSLKIIESDYKNVDPSTLGKHNVYLFDGPHDQEDQRCAIVQMQEALDDDFILIVDDWNTQAVRLGTHQALKELTLSVCFSIEIRTTSDDSYPALEMKHSDWHNGYYIACLKKHN